MIFQKLKLLIKLSFFILIFHFNVFDKILTLENKSLLGELHDMGMGKMMSSDESFFLLRSKTYRFTILS